MLQTILTHTVTNGMLTETYEVLIDRGDQSVFLQNVLDAEEGGPLDTMHIDHKAIRAVIRGLTAIADMLGIPDDVVIVQFPQRPAAHQAPDTIDILPNLRARRSHPADRMLGDLVSKFIPGRAVWSGDDDAA